MTRRLTIPELNAYLDAAYDREAKAHHRLRLQQAEVARLEAAYERAVRDANARSEISPRSPSVIGSGTATAGTTSSGCRRNQ